VDIVGTPLVSLTKIVATGDTPDIFNGYCALNPVPSRFPPWAPAILISEMEVQKKRNFHGQAAHPSAPRTIPRGIIRAKITPRKIIRRQRDNSREEIFCDCLDCGVLQFLCLQACPPTPRTLHLRPPLLCKPPCQPPKPTRRFTPCMTKWSVRAPVCNFRALEKPFYFEYRLMDVDVRAVTASFGSLINSSTTRNRFMSVDVRVGGLSPGPARISSAKDGFRAFSAPPARWGSTTTTIRFARSLARHRPGLQASRHTDVAQASLSCAA